MAIKTLVLTIGLPRSGKSTWALTRGFPIVNPDSVRLALHGQAFIAEAESMVWTIAKYMVRALFLAGHDTVILDATNVTRKRRDDWWSTEWIRKYKVFNASAATCIKRARKGGREDLVPIIERMAEQLEELNDDEWDKEDENA